MKRNKKHENRVRKMVVACSLSAIVLTASTYAWFIGMKTVNVTPFEVNIAAIDGLSLSLNGNDWSDTVSINGTNYNDEATVGAGSQNAWSKLIPMSTVGKINSTKSKLTMYEKGSLTASKGGYRLMASEVNNTADSEIRGYVAFDLFVKNLSGNAYYGGEANALNEEAIYLTTESKVEVSDAGAKADKTGIENSVRVAFAQIGRVEAGSNLDSDTTLRGIKCEGNVEGVTSICARDAQIWEPNDTSHVQNAINWYNKSCASRSNDDTWGEFGTCKAVANEAYSHTYAINTVIDETMKVDVYDGADYNGYGTHPELTEFNYFTDSEKLEKGIARPAFMTLAPKSITKVRVYVYLEGQDVDNYDFASLGKKISVGFGFSKERFTDEDINYLASQGVELPSDVKAKETFVYEKTGNVVVTDSNKAITFDAPSNTFSVPRGIMSFKFTDGVTNKIAKAKAYDDAGKLITEHSPLATKLSPSYLKWSVENDI